MMRLQDKHIGHIGHIRRIGEAVDYAVMYVYDGDHIIAEYSGSGGTAVLARKYIYGPGIDQPVAMINVDGETETWYYYHQDALGSVVALSNSNGNLVERYRYSPFGKQSVYNAADTYIGTTPAYGNPYMFTARRYDPETGLYYYRARMYSPTLGRFLQTDPIGYFDSMNLYQYCGNNPLNFIDPWGLLTSEDVINNVIGFFLKGIFRSGLWTLLTTTSESQAPMPYDPNAPWLQPLPPEPCPSITPSFPSIPGFPNAGSNAPDWLVPSVPPVDPTFPKYPAIGPADPIHE